MLLKILLGTLAILFLMISFVVTIVFGAGTIISFLFSLLAPFYLLFAGKTDVLVIGLAITPFLLMFFKRETEGIELSIPLESMFGFWVCSFRFFSIVGYPQYLNFSAILSAIYFTMALLCYLRKMKDMDIRD